MNRLSTVSALICGLTLTAAALVSGQQNATHGHAAAPAPTKAIAQMRPTKDSKTRGTVIFNQDGEKMKVTALISGLTPGQKHAMHIHEFGDGRGEDGMAAGGHYNPEGHEHGLPEKDKRHAGDLGNIQADDQGNARYEITVDNISMLGKNPILGRGVIIHAKPDDGGQPTGNAGGRIAVGVIGVMNTEWKAPPKGDKK